MVLFAKVVHSTLALLPFFVFIEKRLGQHWYNIKLHAYVVVELKATPFKPEYAGQLNFYINVVDDKLRGENDNKTIGLLLCKGKDEIVAQYALTGYDQPIGISDYQLSKAVPENLKSALPSIEQVEEELTMLLDNEKNKQK